MLTIGLGFGINRGGILPSTPVSSTDFIIRVKTDNVGTSADNQFTLPTTGSGYDFTATWDNGDTTTHSGTPGNITFTRPTEGEHTLTISGTFPRILFNNGGDKSKLIETVNFGDVGWTSMERAFGGCNNMTIATTCSGVMPSGSYVNAWVFCSSITSFPALDLSGGTSFENTWEGCTSMTSFNATALGSGTYRRAWFGCSSLLSFPAVSLAGGTSFLETWEGCTSMTSFNATAMGSGTYLRAWEGCTSLTSFPALDLSGGTNFGRTWNGCTSMTSFNAIAMGSGSYANAWNGCTSLISFLALDLSGGTSFQDAWKGCTSLTSFPALDLSGGTNFREAWRNMGVLTSFATRQFYGMTNGINCFLGTTLPTADWSDILVTQRANNVNINLSFHGGNSKYNVAGGIARGELTTIVADGGQNWSITDGGAE